MRVTVDKIQLTIWPRIIDVMGEQPIWTTRAQIFEIDRTTKTSWIPCTKQTVSISFYHDPNRQTFRIISVDGSKAILNSTITSNMVFTKTAQKFGQWSDPKAGTIYGVGFPTEDDLNKFAETFKEANGSIKSLENKPDSNSSQTAAVQNGPSSKPIRSSSMNSNGSTGSANQDEVTSTTNGSKALSSSMDAQLKYENDKLKLALAQSSANAKKWETELQNLRNNNARLTTALQESTSNVEEWKKQLLMYKEENSHLRTRVQELEFIQNESGKSVENVNQLTTDKISLEHKVAVLEKSLEQQSQEIAGMTLQLSELQNLKLVNSDLADKVRELKAENERLQSASQEFSSRQKTMAEQEGKMAEITKLFTKMNAQLIELNNTRELMETNLKA